MPIRDRITWGDRNPLSDPRYEDVDKYVKELRQGRLPRNVKGKRVFENKDNDLPSRPNGYYTEYDVEPKVQGKDRGTYRIVLGGGGEVFITGNHYRDFRQIINMPSDGLENPWASRVEKERNETLAKLDDFRERLLNQVNLARGEHVAQQAILTNTDSLSGAAIGFAGFVTNKLFNGPFPELLIWDNALIRLASADAAIKGRNVKRAMKDLLIARAHFLAALKKYTTWKDGLQGAATKMQITIGVVAVALVVAAVAAFAATAAAAEGAAVVTAEQTLVRIAAGVGRADTVIRIAEATSLAEEAAAERELEMAIEEFMRLRGF